MTQVPFNRSGQPLLLGFQEKAKEISPGVMEVALFSGVNR
jgi:hypothetical protein